MQALLAFLGLCTIMDYLWLKATWVIFIFICNSPNSHRHGIGMGI
ncbi:MAG: hypothetical protein O4860_15135 [Trichodesmium sp. St2_bin2_1]|nr:hypothetical protein [Trichodesmium sp. St2_bin2_1]